MRQKQVGILLNLILDQDKYGKTSEWGYPEPLILIAREGMDLKDLEKGLEDLLEMDERMDDAPAVPISGHHYYFTTVKNFLKTQRQMLGRILSSLQNAGREKCHLVGRNCGSPYEGTLYRGEKDSTKCEVCGAGPSSFRAIGNWRLMPG